MKLFPLPDDYGITSVPNAVMESILDADAAVGQIAFALRTLWWLERSTTYPKSVQVSDLRSDRTLIACVGSEFDSALAATCKRGIFLRAGDVGNESLMLHTVAAVRQEEAIDDGGDDSANGWDTPAKIPGPPDAYRAYERNIGSLTPMIRESIGQSLQDFTDAQITQAIRVAVENDARSWAFVKAVLSKWNREGIPDERERRGEAGGSRIPETELRRYLDRARSRK